MLTRPRFDKHRSGALAGRHGIGASPLSVENAKIYNLRRIGSPGPCSRVR
jgi:hypothetical protein